MNNAHSQGEPKLHFGNYRGEVVRNTDPKEAGRIKVNVFGVYDGLPTDVLPWATYADPNMGGISEVGSVIVPEEGAHVWVFFEGGDHHFPVYWAGAPAIKDGTPDLPEESRREESQYPMNKVTKTKSGILVERDDTPDKVRFRIYHPSGNDYLIDNDGNETRDIIKNQTTNIGGDNVSTTEGTKTENVTKSVTENYDDTHTSTVGGAYTKNAAEVTINSDGIVEIVAGGDVNVTATGNVNATGATINLN